VPRRERAVGSNLQGRLKACRSPLRGARSARYQSGDESPHSKGVALHQFVQTPGQAESLQVSLRLIVGEASPLFFGRLSGCEVRRSESGRLTKPRTRPKK
jgi:hypothetical protein